MLSLFIYLNFSLGKDMCSPENRLTDDGFAECMNAIKSQMTNQSAFWFGTDYAAKCPVPMNTLECSNFDPRPTSMAERLLSYGGFEAEALTSYLNVVIHEMPGK